MPRRKIEEGAVQPKKRKQGTSRRTATSYDLKPVIDSVSQQVFNALGLDMFGFSLNDVKGVVSDMVYSIAEGRSTKLTEEAALKRVMAAKDNILKALASQLLMRAPRLTREQLDFIVSYAPESAGRAAPYLYKEARRLGAQDVVDYLRSLWARFGSPTPVECPRCGFRSVTPDLTCMVCGAQLSEREVKVGLNFPRALVEAARRMHPRLVEEMIAAGYVVLDGEIHPPSLAPRGGFSLTLHLNREEKEALKSLLQSGGPGVSSEGPNVK